MKILPYPMPGLSAFLKTPALYAIPILGHNDCLGAMVIGVDSDLSQTPGQKQNPAEFFFPPDRHLS